MKEKYSFAIRTCLIAFLILGIGELFAFAIEFIATYFEFSNTAFGECFIMYFSFIGIWISYFLFCSIKKDRRPLNKVVSNTLTGNTVKLFVCGLLLGFAMNMACAIAAMINKDIKVSFDTVNVLGLLAVLFAVVVQSGAEELICRGFIYKNLENKGFGIVSIIVINSLFFAVLHLSNSGVTPISLIAIFMAGVLPSLCMYYFDSLWMAIGWHATWNYTQNIILGLPNSGIVLDFSIFKLDIANARNSFFYNVGFGIEGSVFAIILMVIVCVLIYQLRNNKTVNRGNIFENH